MKAETISKISEALKRKGFISGKFLSARKHKTFDCIIVTLRTKDNVYYHEPTGEIESFPKIEWCKLPIKSAWWHKTWDEKLDEN